MSNINKVCANVAQEFTDAEKAQARNNINASRVATASSTSHGPAYTDVDTLALWPSSNRLAFGGNTDTFVAPYTNDNADKGKVLKLNDSVIPDWGTVNEVPEVTQAVTGEWLYADPDTMTAQWRPYYPPEQVVIVNMHTTKPEIDQYLFDSKLPIFEYLEDDNTYWYTFSYVEGDYYVFSGQSGYEQNKYVIGQANGNLITWTRSDIVLVGNYLVGEQQTTSPGAATMVYDMYNLNGNTKWGFKNFGSILDAQNSKTWQWHMQNDNFDWAELNIRGFWRWADINRQVDQSNNRNWTPGSWSERLYFEIGDSQHNNLGQSAIFAVIPNGTDDWFAWQGTIRIDQLHARTAQYIQMAAVATFTYPQNTYGIVPGITWCGLREFNKKLGTVANI